MTAMVSLDYDGNLERKIMLPGSVRLPKGEYTRNDLMNAMLVRSDNGAAEAIAADYPGGRKGFIAAMNSKANQIGMVNTKFVDPSGLGAGNLSNVASVAVMIQVAALYPFIKETSIQKETKVEKRRFTIVMDNTNRPLLMDFDEIVLSKTGFTSAAGWNVGLVVEKHDQRFSVVVLGASNKEQRYNLTKKIIKDYFKDIEIEVEEKKNKTLLETFKEWWTRDE